MSSSSSCFCSVGFAVRLGFGSLLFAVRVRDLSEKENLKLESAVILKFDLMIHEARNRNSFSTWNSSCIYFKMNLSFVSNFKKIKKSEVNYFEIGLSGVRLPVVGSLVDFVLFAGARGSLPTTQCLLLPMGDNPCGV